MSPLDRIAAGIPIDRILSHDLVNFQLTYAQGPWAVTGYVPNAYPNEPRRYGVRVNREF